MALASYDEAQMHFKISGERAEDINCDTFV
jgi:hypothetical protein